MTTAVRRKADLWPAKPASAVLRLPQPGERIIPDGARHVDPSPRADVCPPIWQLDVPDTSLGAKVHMKAASISYANHQRSTALKPSRLQLAPISSWATFLERAIT